MAETDTASTITPSISTAVTYTVGPIVETDSTAPVFNPLRGYRISDPLALPGTPVTGSVVRWSASTPAAGSAVTVETSINFGASWEPAVNGGQVPRLLPGDTATLAVLTRVTLTRASASDTSPRLSLLEVQVSCDASVDEMVPLAHGMIVKTRTTTAGGTMGTSTVTSGGGTGVTSHGGGQTGSGISIRISGVDPSRAISRNAWQQPFFVGQGTNYADAVVAMILDRLPTQTAFSLTSTTRTTPLLLFGVDQGGDPWQDIQDLATAIGFEVFFDAAGVLVFRPVSDPRLKVPVWALDETTDCTMTEVKRELSDEQTFNYVIVQGQSTSSKNPFNAFAFDDDPSSATYIGSDYGTVTTRLIFTNIITQDQAQQTAGAILLNSLGAADTLTITMVPHPALEPGDVLTVNVPDTRANGTYLINQMTTSLSPADPQQLTCFRQSSKQ